MGRRGLSSLRAVLVVAIVLLIVYGYYTYNELQAELEKRNTREDRIKRQVDTLSSELETLYESKVNLEKIMKTEEEETKKSKEELEKHAQLIEVKYAQEKEELSSRVNAIAAENKRLEGRNDDLERELNMLNEKDRKLEEDKNKIAEQYKKEYMELKTDRDAIIVQLKATVAQLEQHNSNTEDELKARVSDIHSLQNALNNSQHEYSKLEHLLKAAQQDSAQQQQRYQELVAIREKEAALKNVKVDENVDRKKQLQPDAAAAAGINYQFAGSVPAGDTRKPDAKVPSDQQLVGDFQHHAIIAGVNSQHVAGVGGHVAADVNAGAAHKADVVPDQAKLPSDQQAVGSFAHHGNSVSVNDRHDIVQHEVGRRGQQHVDGQVADDGNFPHGGDNPGVNDQQDIKQHEANGQQSINIHNGNVKLDDGLDKRVLDQKVADDADHHQADML